MVALKLIAAALMAFIVFMGTVYVLSKLFFEKVEIDDHVPEGKIRTSKFKIIND